MKTQHNIPMKRFAIALLFILIGFSVKAQQDPQFSQYMFNPLTVNPAYAGSRGVMNGALVYRQQWVSFPGAPNTQVFAINTPLRKGKVGLGAEVVRDQIGPKNSIGAYIDYAYRIPLGKGKLAFGLGAGMVSYHIRWSDIDYRDQADAYNQLGDEVHTLPDVKFGVYFNNKKFFTGLSITHLNRAQYGHFIADSITSTAVMRRHSFFTIGRAFALGSNFTFSPSFMLRGVIGTRLYSADVNLNFRYKEVIWFGASFRSESSVIVMAQYSINDKWKVGYSYDAAFGRMAGYHGGSHELMLGFDLNLFQSDVMSPRYF
jgi:type IX secretion system PorP/SprF family membrane protein